MRIIAVVSFLTLIGLLAAGCSSQPVASPAPSIPSSSSTQWPFSTTITPTPAPAQVVTITPPVPSSSATPWGRSPTPAASSPPKTTSSPPPGYKPPTITPGQTAAVTTAATLAVSSAEWETLKQELKDDEGKLAGFDALQANFDTVSAANTRLQTEVSQLRNDILRLQGQMSVSYGLNYIVRDNVELHQLVMTNTLNGLLAGGYTTYCDFSFRVYNASGRKVAKLDIAGYIQSSTFLGPENPGYPNIIDASNQPIGYHSAYDQQNKVYFELYYFDINNNSSLDFRPRIQLQNPKGSSEVYNFTVTITGFSFLESDK